LDQRRQRRCYFVDGALDWWLSHFGTVAILTPAPGPAESILERAEGVLERLKDDIKGELQDLREDVREEVAYPYGMESYVYGYPLVMMNVTRQVLTAAPAPNSEGTAAPINQLAKMPHYNQLAKMPHYVSPYFKNVVRISLNSLWTTAG
jgi:hypothetical protein